MSKSEHPVLHLPQEIANIIIEQAISASDAPRLSLHVLRFVCHGFNQLVNNFTESLFLKLSWTGELFKSKGKLLLWGFDVYFNPKSCNPFARVPQFCIPKSIV